MIGGLGNDDMTGGTGTDNAVYGGDRSDFTITQNLDGSYTVVDLNAGDGDEGTDVLNSVENLTFGADAFSYELDTNSPDFSGALERFSESFESGDTSTSFPPTTGYGSVTISADGTGGINTLDGGNYGLFQQSGAPGDESGPFSRFDGYRSGLEGGFTTSFDVYLDDTMMLAGEGFDVSVAGNNQAGVHFQDFIMHVTHDTSTGNILIGGSNNTNFDPREDLENQNHVEITSAGWYTMEWKFYENDLGDVEVAMNVYDSSGTWIFTEIRSDAVNDFDTVYGGNRYLWFTNIDVASGIAVDEMSMSTIDTNPVQLATGSTITASFATITEAVAAASAGDTVLIADGDYAAEASVNVTVDDLTFSAGAGATGIELNLAEGGVEEPAGPELGVVTTVTLTGDADIDVLGNENANVITGNDGANYLRGGVPPIVIESFETAADAVTDDDTLIGAGGNDTLDGGVGDDQMEGGTGDDLYLVDSALDVVVELDGEGTDTVETTLGTYALGDNVEHATFTGTGSYRLDGTTVDNILIGGDDGGRLNGKNGNDTIIGGDGEDVLIASKGDDSLDGGEADDTFNIRTTGDVINDTGTTTEDRVKSEYIDLDLSVHTGVEEAQLTGTLDLNLTGDAGDNKLYGNDGANRIEGGSGRDLLRGEGGDDFFVFSDVTDSDPSDRDKILDFEQGTVTETGDIIDLFGIDAIEGGRNNAFTFIGTDSFSESAGELRYQLNGGGTQTIVSADTDGDGEADLQFNIAGAFVLEDADFVL